MKLITIALVFIAAVGVLVGVGIRASAIPIVKYHELVAGDASVRGPNIRVDDALIHSIEQKFPSCRFRVAPKGYEDRPMLVVSDTAPPENFDPGKQIGLEGTYDPATHTFTAYKLTTKCPSRYDAKAEGDRILEEEKKAAQAQTSVP